ncbi:hypothetical protein ABPG72_005029 [Tetrahymena utriculariae]
MKIAAIILLGLAVLATTSVFLLQKKNVENVYFDCGKLIVNDSFGTAIKNICPIEFVLQISFKTEYGYETYETGCLQPNEVVLIKHQVIESSQEYEIKNLEC